MTMVQDDIKSSPKNFVHLKKLFESLMLSKAENFRPLAFLREHHMKLLLIR